MAYETMLFARELDIVKGIGFKVFWILESDVPGEDVYDV